MDKEYTAVFKLGMTTDTWDIEGKVIEKKDIIDVKSDDLKIVISGIVGVFDQIPPIYSAKKIKGKPAYYYARSKRYDNKDIRLKSVPVNIYGIDIISFNGSEVKIKVSCSSGTYIRSLVYEIGKKLGCGATLIELTRERIDGFDLKDSIKLEEIKLIYETGNLKNYKKSFIKVDIKNGDF